MGELEGLLPWTPAGASSRSCSFVIGRKREREEEAKGPFECERTSEKRERQKKGRKVLGFNCVRRIQRKERRKKQRNMKGSRDNVIWQRVCVCVGLCAC